MKKYLKYLSAFVLLLGILTPGLAQNKATVIYLVRHAEKDLSNPQDKNPPLSQAGNIRANHLAEKLKNEKMDAIYSTDYLRTQNTVKPLARQKNIQVKSYEGSDYEHIKQMIAADSGKTILICGHSNTLIPIIEALGVKSPVASISEEEYDNFFKVTIDRSGKAAAVVEKYR